MKQKFLLLSLLSLFLFSACEQEQKYTETDGGVVPLKWQMVSCNNPGITVALDKSKETVNVTANGEGEFVLECTNSNRLLLNCIYINNRVVEYEDPGYFQDHYSGYEDDNIKFSITENRKVSVTVKNHSIKTGYIVCVTNGSSFAGDISINIEP